MFWNCSFQRVYRRVFGSADSKGVSELANKKVRTNQSQELTGRTDGWGTPQGQKQSQREPLNLRATCQIPSNKVGTFGRFARDDNHFFEEPVRDPKGR